MYYERLVSHDLILAMKESNRNPRNVKMEKAVRAEVTPHRRAAGDQRAAPSYAGPLFTPEEWTEIIARIGLSTRKSEIAALILKDLTDEEIAQALGVKKPTVRAHLSQMLRRLKVGSRLGLAIKIFETFRRIVEEARHHQK